MTMTDESFPEKPLPLLPLFLKNIFFAITENLLPVIFYVFSFYYIGKK